MTDDPSNGSHLVPQRLDRRAMAKMRNKLSVAGREDKQIDPPRLARPKRSVRIWPFVIALGLALGGMTLAMRVQQGDLPGFGAKGATRFNKAPRLEPPHGLSLDEQTRFWCYAVYDYPRLKSRFKLPKGAYADKQTARANLDRLLSEEIGAAVRNEVFVYQHARETARASNPPAGNSRPGSIVYYASDRVVSFP